MRHGREEQGGIATWGKRLTALLALAAASVVVIMVVASGLEGFEDSGEEGEDDRRPGLIEGCEPSDPDVLRQGYYVIQPGEPGLSIVTQKTCVPIERIERLNPDLDPQLVPEQECVNLRPDGCDAQGEG